MPLDLPSSHAHIYILTPITHIDIAHPIHNLTITAQLPPPTLKRLRLAIQPRIANDNSSIPEYEGSSWVVFSFEGVSLWRPGWWGEECQCIIVVLLWVGGGVDVREMEK